MNLETKSVFTKIFFILLLDLIAFALILPLLPKILDFYSQHDQSGGYKLYRNFVKVFNQILNVHESHNQVLLAGLLGSWFSVLQFLSSPLVGALSDNYGRRPIFLITMLGTLTSYLVWYMSEQSFTLFVLSRTLGGLCRANVGLALAMMTDVSSEQDRGKAMAIIGSSFSLGFILGPMLGAYLSTSALQRSAASAQLISNPATVAILLSVISLSMVLLLLDETNVKLQSPKNRSTHDDNHLKRNTTATNILSFTKILQFINPAFLLNFSLVYESKVVDKNGKVLKDTGMICFTYILFYSGLEFTLPFLTHIKFGFTPMDQGKLYLFSGILMILIQAGYIRRPKSAGNEPKMLLVGLSSIVPAFGLMGFATSIGQVYCALALYALSSAIAVPCLTTMISLHCPEKSRGAALGTFRSIGSLARALGPVLASVIFFTFGAKVCYMLGSVSLIYPFLRMVTLYKDLEAERRRQVEANGQTKASVKDSNNNTTDFPCKIKTAKEHCHKRKPTATQ